MITLPDRVIVAANNGLYEIMNRSARVIIEESYFYAISASEEKDVFVAATPDDLYILTQRDNRWIVEKHESPDESIQSIYISSKDSLWLGSYDLVYKAVRDQGENGFSFTKYDLKKNFFEPVDIRKINEQLFFFQNSNHYRLSRDTIVSDNRYLLASERANKGILPNEDYTWMYQGGFWESIPKIDGIDNSKPYLNLFNNLKHIHADRNKNIWIITDDDKLYKISSPADFNYSVRL
jgi:ligand-binding sensor domain-containing protein